MNDNYSLIKGAALPRTQQAFQRIRDERRERILDAAAAVFADKGIAATKVGDLAEAAGISHGLLYRYFPSKEDVYVELLERTVQAAVRRVQIALDTSWSPWEKLRGVTEQFLRGMTEEPIYYRIFSQALALSGRVRQAIEKLEDLRDTLREIIVSGQAAGQVVDDDPDRLVLLYLGCLFGLAAGAGLSSRRLAPHFPDANAVLRMLEA